MKESKGRRTTVKEVKKWMKTLEENRYKKTYASDARRVSWLVNNNLSEDYESMPKSMRKKWTKAAYGREKYLAKEFLKSQLASLKEQLAEQKIRKAIRGIIKEQLNKGKLTEDYKNSEWEVYLKDEKGREKIVKKAKSKRAATILYNKIIKSDKYYEVGMRAIKESVNENRMYNKGDVVSLLSFDRRHRGKARVKGVTKARPNKFGINNHYITNKGTFSDMEVEGTKAFKLRFKGNTEKKVMKAMNLESVNEVNIVPLKLYINWFKKDAKKAKVTPLEYTKYQIKNPSFYGLDKKTLKALLKYFQKNESVNEIRNKREAETLLQQLGGNKFKMMTGAKNFGIDGKSLTFSIGRNSKGINFVRIKLTSMDLYDIQFAQLRMGQVKVKSTAKRVYGDQLGKVFKKHTGMNVRLFGETINEAPKNYDRAMKKMLDFMKKSAYKQYDKRFPFHIESNTWQYPKLLKKGRTFDKLVTVRNNAPNKAQSADFFVHRETGDIYKAGSWSAPAKGRRGSIFEPNTYKHYDIHGGWLYRRR